MIDIRELTEPEARQHVSALAEVLLDCVAGGASVSFMAALTKFEAEVFFTKSIDAVERGERILLAAFKSDEPEPDLPQNPILSRDGNGAVLVGTVQIITATPPNQPHRADIAKLLVHRSARGQGVAKLLMQHAEVSSRQAGKTLLVLDTVTGGAAESLYTRMGWNKAGIIPNYALFPDGNYCDTTIFWKSLPSG